jgi:hypothetical protein
VDTVESDPVLLGLLLSHGPSTPPAGYELRLPLADQPPATDAANATASASETPEPKPEAAKQPAGKRKFPPQPRRLMAPPAAFATGRDAISGHASPPRLASPLAVAAAAERPYSVIDVSPEFLDQGQANKYVLTAEGVARLVQSLDEHGLLSLPMGIGELPVYALKAVTTARAGLELAGVSDPARHLLVVRSAFTARILVSRRAFDQRDIDAAKAFAAERSFDVPYFPGIDPAREEIFNDLPPVSFESVTTMAEDDNAAAVDALRDDLIAFLRDGRADSSSFRFFNLAPSTQDRPFFHEIIQIGRASCRERVS